MQHERTWLPEPDMVWSCALFECWCHVVFWGCGCQNVFDLRSAGTTGSAQPFQSMQTSSHMAGDAAPDVSGESSADVFLHVAAALFFSLLLHGSFALCNRNIGSTWGTHVKLWTGCKAVICCDNSITHNRGSLIKALQKSRRFPGKNRRMISSNATSRAVADRREGGGGCKLAGLKSFLPVADCYELGTHQLPAQHGFDHWSVSWSSFFRALWAQTPGALPPPLCCL